MHMLSKIFNTLEKVASDNKRIIQSHDTMEKAAATVTHGLRALLKARKDSVTRAMRKNPKLTRQQALDAFYKRYGLQVGKGGKISAIEGAKLNNRALVKQQEWLAAMKQNKNLSRDIKNLRVLDPAKQGTRLMHLNKKYNFSERGDDFIVPQKPIVRKGKMLQNNFRLNRKRMLNSQPKNNPPGPAPKPGPDGGQYGPTSPAPADAPVGNGLFNNNWWKYGLAGAGGALLGRITAPNPQPMPAMMPPQPMPATMYNGMQY